MANLTALGGTTALALILGSAAQADVTAQQVWQSWQDFSASMGQTLTAGSQNIANGVLTVSDVTVSGAAQGGTMTGAIDRIIFAEQGDGTVKVTLSPEYPMIVTTDGPDGTPQEMRMTLRQTDLDVRVSGDASVMTYDIAGPQIALLLDSVTGPDVPADMGMELGLNGVDGRYTLTETASQGIETRFNAENVTLGLRGTSPEDQSTFAINATMADVSTTSQALFPRGVDLKDMAAALQAGFTSNGAFIYGATTYAMEFTQPPRDGTPPGNGRLAGAADSGTLNFAVSKERMTYGGTTIGTDITVSGLSLPVPQLTGQIAEAGFELQLPISTSAVPQDFGLVNRIVGLTLGDEVWQLFDPSSVLPRDPATLIVDLAGKGNWLVDMLSITPGQPPAETPLELSEMTLNAAQLRVAGAELNASGAVTFDNTQTGPGAGMRPTGTVNATLAGANALLDKLVQMGLLPNDQAMGARMMLGVFAQPGTTPDLLTSTVEFKPDGSILANGQQIR